MKIKFGILALMVASTVMVPVAVASEAVDKAREDYTFQLDRYRELYAEFELKRTQYENNPTFAHQEELVEAAKGMLLKRAEVWWTYFQAVRIDVLESAGFDEELKSETVADLKNIQDGLKDHQDELQATQVKQDLQLKAQEVNDKQGNYESTAYLTLREIRLARMRAVITELQTFATDLRPAIGVQVREVNLRESRLRGMDEADRLLSEADTMVGLVDEENDTEFQKQSRADKLYEDARVDLREAYNNVFRAYNLLKELSEGIDL